MSFGNNLNAGEDSNFRYFLIAIGILATLVAVGGIILYWQSSMSPRTSMPPKSYGDVYANLGLRPLPRGVEASPEIERRLEQLKREPCFKDAVAELSEELSKAGYPRESANSLIGFVKHCPGSDFLLANAYDPLLQIGDLKGAFTVADELVQAYPAKSQFRYWRGRVRDQLNDYPNALNDYINAVQLDPEPKRLVGDVYYNISRMYAALKRYCDAITPMETYISFDPAERRNPQTMRILTDYAEKGHCDTRYATGTARVSLMGSDRVHTLAVTVNGVIGNFVLDTGASYVSVTRGFAVKAKLTLEAGNQVLMKTVSGITPAEVAYADKVEVGQAQAQGVVVAVLPTEDAFGNHLDGLLGMSFLARFSLNVSQSGIELKALPLR